jgi:acetyltransferase-like isoleucine patch superfamily enzyme
MTSSISKTAIIGKNVVKEGEVTICGATQIKSGTRIGFNVIIGYPSFKTLKNNKGLNFIDSGEGAIIGENCYIRPSSHIYESVEIGDKTQTGHRIFIRENTKIGSNCIIGTNSIIDGNTIIGKNTKLESNVYLPLKNKIGNNNFIAPRVCVTNDKRPLPFCIFDNSIKPKQDSALEGITTEDNVCIGANSTILPGVKIGYGAVVGAGAVVTKDVKAETVVLGVPAKPMSIDVYDLLKKHVEILLSRDIRKKEDVSKLKISKDLKTKIKRALK